MTELARSLAVADCLLNGAETLETAYGRKNRYGLAELIRDGAEAEQGPTVPDQSGSYPSWDAFVAALASYYGEEHPDHTQYDWARDVANGDTLSGYWDWVGHQLEMAAGGGTEA